MVTKAMLLSCSLFSKYWELCKPRVVMLMILTSIVGMCLASRGSPSLSVLLLGNLGIALCASAAAAINHLADYRIDQLMRRTQDRPVAQGRVSILETIIFACTLCCLGQWILIAYINLLTAVLTFGSLVVYAGIYTFYLKHATAQNIVIGGIAGAMPPMLGWVAVTNSIGWESVFLVLIIFVWTPPHFWALAIARIDEYANAKVPMLPNTKGIAYTKKSMLVYTVILSIATLLPYFFASAQLIYLTGVSMLDAWFFFAVWQFYRDDQHQKGMRVFMISIYYLMLLFVLLLVDHYLPLSIHNFV